MDLVGHDGGMKADTIRAGKLIPNRVRNMKKKMADVAGPSGRQSLQPPATGLPTNLIRLSAASPAITSEEYSHFRSGAFVASF